MSASTSFLNDVRINSPCQIAWETMTGNDRVRFCHQCELHVYNISAMNRNDAEAFLQEKEGRRCLRLYRRVDGTVLTSDCMAGGRSIRRGRRGMAPMLWGLAALIV